MFEFFGLIAVGAGQTASSGNFWTSDIGIIYTSLDGYNWNQVVLVI
jgi:hypothetical protein